MTENVFSELSKVDVSSKIEKKGNLSYLSWAYAWGELQKKYPEATYTIEKFDNNLPYVHDEGTGYMVFTNVTVGGTTREMMLPVMDNRNKALKAATMFDINKAIMRCLVKNIAMFGLGLNIYAGEDLPTSEPEKPAEKQMITDTQKATIISLAEKIADKKVMDSSEILDGYLHVGGVEKLEDLPKDWADGLISQERKDLLNA